MSKNHLMEIFHVNAISTRSSKRNTRIPTIYRHLSDLYLLYLRCQHLQTQIQTNNYVPQTSRQQNNTQILFCYPVSHFPYILCHLSIYLFLPIYSLLPFVVCMKFCDGDVLCRQAVYLFHIRDLFCGSL